MARIQRSPPGSGSPASPVGCRSRGARRSRAVRRCSCSAPRARSVSSPSRPPGCSVPPESWRPVAVPRGSSAPRSTVPTRRSASTRPATSWRPSKRRSAAKARATFSTPCGASPQRPRSRLPLPRATIVNLGQSAGATAELASAAVRFKNLSILGHTNFAVPADELAEHYRRLVDHAIAGEIRLEVERDPARLGRRRVAPSGGRRRNEARRRPVAAALGGAMRRHPPRLRSTRRCPATRLGPFR